MSLKLNQHDVDFFNTYALHFRQSYIHLANLRKPMAEFISKHPSSLPSMYDEEFVKISFSGEEFSPDEDFIYKTINTLQLVNNLSWKDSLWRTFLIPSEETVVKKDKYKSTYYNERTKYILDFNKKINDNKDIVEVIEQEIVPHSQLSLL